jgi:hypothetical protein
LGEAPSVSAVGWGAIVAGAVGALATSIILITLGAGLGLSAASPWAGEGMSAKAIGVTAVIWLVVVQWLSAAIGGYLTGRLRLRWNYFDRDEVFFRDTAHGFLAWGLAVAIVALSATTMTSGLIGSATTGAAAGAASKSHESSMGYFADSLYRVDTPATPMATTDQATPGAVMITPAPRKSPDDTNAETVRILSQGIGDDLAPDDRAYLAHLVAQRTGMTDQDAQQRVDAVVTKAKTAADKARKAAATLAIMTALSLAIGAFIAAVAAGYGGHLRDD